MNSVKTLYILTSAFSLMAGHALANDLENNQPSLLTPSAMPVLQPGEYGTDADNQNNAGTGIADGDMGLCIYNRDVNHPIEFDIKIPSTQKPATRSAALRMEAFDVDINTDPSNPEIDKVYVNGMYVGTLTGGNNIWGVNYFDIPVGTLKDGNNTVKIDVDKHNSGWCLKIDWGLIALSGTVSGATISKAWISPIRQKAGGFINVFAEIGGTPASVKVYDGTAYLFDLKDADGDHTWSAAYQIPASWTVGYKQSIYIKAFNSAGQLLSRWPGFTVQQ